MSESNGLGPTGYLPPTNAANVGRIRQYARSCAKCGARRLDRQIGLEPTVELYVAEIVACMREVWRVLRDDGVLWLNLGDSFNGAGDRRGGKGDEHGQMKKWATKVRGLKPKDLIGIPWRVAFALQADGWFLRSDIVWSKPNPMPESVTDRPTRAHEYVFLLSKQARYYYDGEAVREPAEYGYRVTKGVFRGGNYIHQRGPQDNSKPNGGRNSVTGKNPESGRNRRSVWTINSEPTPEAHFATFPQKLVEPMILAGSRPGDLVIDPFCGSATVARVAARFQRRFAGCDLNPAYFEIARRRTSRVQVEMFA